MKTYFLQFTMANQICNEIPLDTEIASWELTDNVADTVAGYDIDSLFKQLGIISKKEEILLIVSSLKRTAAAFIPYMREHLYQQKEGGYKLALRDPVHSYKIFQKDPTHIFKLMFKIHKYQIYVKGLLEYKIITDDLLPLEDIVKNAQPYINDEEWIKSYSLGNYSLSLMIQQVGDAEWNKLYLKKKFDAASQYAERICSNAIRFQKPEYNGIEGKYKELDAHQHYPSIMVNKKMPGIPLSTGKGKPVEKDGEIYICEVILNTDDMTLKEIPANLFMCPLDIEGSIERIVLMFSFEAERWEKLGAKIEYVRYTAYSAIDFPGKNYLIYNNEMREKCRLENKETDALRYKLLNNIIYGKTLQRANDMVDDDKTEFAVGRIYNPLIGRCIVSWGRTLLLDKIIAFGPENIVRANTDSITFISNEKTEEVLKTIHQGKQLGDWEVKETYVLLDFVNDNTPYRGLTEDGVVKYAIPGTKVVGEMKWEDIDELKSAIIKRYHNVTLPHGIVKQIQEVKMHG